MTTLTQDQQEILNKFDEFQRSPSTLFLIEGGAGTGKTFLLGQILSQIEAVRAVAAPTHKAINVLRKKLEVEWCQGFDDYSYNGTDVITGTTAQLLGIAPVISDDQGTELKFGHKGNGILSKIMPKLVVIDEVSMLGARDFRALFEQLKRAGSKLLAVGDAGQLPPVKQQAIPFDKIQNRSVLRQIVRQVEGSAIIKLAWAIRDGEDWTKISGDGVRRDRALVDAFLEAARAPGERREEDREVFIAYTNRRVNDVQERACQKVYGHGRLAFAPGELVLAETNLYRAKVLLCANQDELIVNSFDVEGRSEIGIPVTLHHRGRPGSFSALYVPPEELRNPEHPYNVELRRREAEARMFQERWKALPNTDIRRESVNVLRKRAWAAFFDWRDQTIISFRHPFAITSHKSQGSTYRQVFADSADIGRFSTHALYVAVTRPREELILAT